MPIRKNPIEALREQAESPVDRYCACCGILRHDLGDVMRLAMELDVLAGEMDPDLKQIRNRVGWLKRIAERHRTRDNGVAVAQALENAKANVKERLAAAEAVASILAEHREAMPVNHRNAIDKWLQLRGTR